MIPPPMPADEEARLRALRGYAILDTLPEQAYDDVTCLASQICGTPTALVSLVDQHRQWFKSALNFHGQETSRDTAFCAHAILEEDLFVVPNALEDERFVDNELVRGETGVRFYAGAPLMTPDGHAIGTLCVMDQKPRELTPEQRACLRALARQVMAQLELRRHLQELERRVKRTTCFQEALRTLAQLKHHDLDHSLRRITQADAEALAVTRVSVWMFNAELTELTCPMLFHSGKGFQPTDAILTAELCPNYFRAMEESRVLAAPDAESDPRTREFTDWYLRPLGIVSMLDVPVWLRGRMVGLICHESVGERREWTDDERDFAASIADMVSFACEAAERFAAEQSLRASEEKFKLFFEASGDPVMLAIHDRVIDCNQAAVDLLGYRTKDQVVSLHPWEFSPEFQEDGQPSSVKAPVMIGTAYEKGYHRFEWTHQRADGGTFPAEISLTLMELRGQKVMFTILRDITERKRAEADLHVAYLDLQEARTGLERAVGERTAQLADTNDALRHEIAEHQRTEEALRATHAEAERANLAKSEFLSRMSHELRTPMNSILGFSQVLAHKLTDPAQRKNVDHILHAGKHLLELINEVLDISRIEANRMQLSPEPVQLRRIVAEALAIIQPLAAQRDCQLVDHVAGCPHYVMADSQRLTQVLLNLLSNAVKYNKGGGRVILTCALRPGDRLRLAIEDTGRGLSPAAMERLFNPFDRLGAESYGIEGTGLGLVLSKRLIEVMGGTMVVESEEGRGSVFAVELMWAENPRERLERSSRERPPADPLALETTRAVLYIEDNVANLSLIETIFAERPAIVLRSALQGRLGLALAFEHCPDLILLDLHLPDMTGEAVLRELKSDARTRDIPVVIISADATAGQQERLVQAGALSYLTKPLDMDRLLETVDLVLRDRTTNGP